MNKIIKPLNLQFWFDTSNVFYNAQTEKTFLLVIGQNIIYEHNKIPNKY